MAVSSRLDTLRNIEFFQGIEDGHLQQLAEISRDVEFQARVTMFHEHDSADKVYVIVSGEVSLAICAAKGSCRQIMVARDGDLMGWSSLLGRARLSDTALTLTPVKAVVFEGGQLMELCRQNPELGFEFMRRSAEVLAERLSATRLQLFEMSGIRLPEVQVDTD